MYPTDLDPANQPQSAFDFYHEAISENRDLLLEAFEDYLADAREARAELRDALWDLPSNSKRICAFLEAAIEWQAARSSTRPD